MFGYRRVYISRENFMEFEFTARCPGRTSMLSGTAGHAHMEALSKTNGGGIERHFQGAQRRVKEYQECATKRRAKTAKPIVEEAQQRDEGIVRMDEDAPATSSSSCSAAPSSSTNKGSEAARMDKRTNIERIPSVCRWRVDDSRKKQKEDGGRRGRKDGDEDRHMSQDVGETAGRRLSRSRQRLRRSRRWKYDLDPEHVRQGRKEEMNCMVKTLEMLELGSWEDTMTRGGKIPTTTKWVDGVKKADDGREFERCR